MVKHLRSFSLLTLVGFVLAQVLGMGLVRAETVEMQFDAGQPLHAPKVVNGVDFLYDRNGNLENDGERVISWNQDNLPVKIIKDGVEVSLFYDADGRRLVKQIGQDRTKRTVYVNQYYQQLVTSNQQLATSYYFAGGRRLASQVTSNQSPVTSYYHHDYLGSTVLATDSKSQPISKALSYFPYGNLVNNPIIQLSNNPKYLFTGQELESESGLYNYNARLYNPETGVFVSADTEEGQNRYAYVLGNPLILRDPSGNFAVLALLAIAAFAGWMATGGLASSGTAGPSPVQWSPLEAETNLSLFRMAVPPASAAIGAYEAYSGKNLATGRELTPAETALNVVDVGVSGFTAADKFLGGVNTWYQVNRVSKYYGGESVLRATSVGELENAVLKNYPWAQFEVSEVRGSVGGFYDPVNTRIISYMGRKLSVLKHESVHLLQAYGEHPLYRNPSLASTLDSELAAQGAEAMGRPLTAQVGGALASAGQMGFMSARAGPILQGFSRFVRGFSPFFRVSRAGANFVYQQHYPEGW